MNVMRAVDRHGVSMPEARNPIIVAAIVVISFVLRMYDIGANGFNRDELSTLQYAGENLGAMLRGTDLDVHPPFYYVILHFWMLAFGQGEVAVRTLSAVMGTAVTWLAYVVGRRLINTTAGLFAAVIIAFLPPHIYYSQLARMYELLMICVLLSAWAAAEFAIRPRFLTAAAYVFSATSMIYTQYTSVFFILALSAFFLAIKLRVSPRAAWVGHFAMWFLLHVAVLLLYSPWLSTAIRQTQGLQAGFWVARESMTRYMGGLFLIFSGTTRYPASYVLAVFLFLTSAVGVLAARRWWISCGSRRDGSAADGASGIGLSVFLAILPGFGLAAASQFLQPIFVPRAVIASSVAVYWLAGAGLSRLPEKLRIGIFGLCLLASAVMTMQYFSADRSDYREDVRLTFAAVVRLAQPKDVIFLVGWPVARDYFDVVARGQAGGKGVLPQVATLRQGELATAIAGWCPARPDRRLIMIVVESGPIPVHNTISKSDASALLDRAGLVQAGLLAGLDETAPVQVWSCRQKNVNPQ